MPDEYLDIVNENNIVIGQIMKNKPTCKTGLKKNIIKKPVFEREIFLCRKLAKEKKGRCGWGKCKDCGVVPLLYKLHKGKLLEKDTEIKAVKKKVLSIPKIRL